MREPTQSDLKLIHARVFCVYMEYCRVRHGWSDLAIDEFLSSVGTSWARLREDSSWYTLAFTDDFYERLKAKTGISNLAYEAGAFIYSKNFSPTIFYLARGLMEVGTLYRLLARFTTYFTRASMWNVVDISANQAQITSRPLIEGGDRLYICENRRGILSALPKVFGLDGAQVEETECIHRGGQLCRYSIRWSEFAERPLKLRALVIGILAGTIAHIAYNSITVDLSVFAALLMLNQAWIMLKNRRSKFEALFQQNQILDESLKKLERKTTELSLISQIINLVLQSESISDLGKAVVQNVCVLLNYDRSILLLVDAAEAVLRVEAFHGFDDNLGRLLSETKFNISPDNRSGFFVRVVTTGKPLIVQDVAAEMSQLSARSRKFAELLKASSFVAVPILDKLGRSVGVLAVDYTTTVKKMNLQDQDLLMTLGQNLGFALQTTQLLDDLRKNLQNTTSLSERETRLRSLFQKFIPDSLAQEMTLNTEPGELARVAKKEKAAILFFDIADFSSWSEMREAEEMVQAINKILGEVVPEISKFGGVVDKFLGDGLIAVFRGNSASLRSAHAALGIMNRIKAFSKLNTESSELIGISGSMSVGIGMAFGPIVFGNVGTSDRLNYTVMGEVVNLASRLQGLARQMGANRICASSAWVSDISKVGEPPSELKIADLGERPIKGYSKEIRAFELLTDDGGLSSELKIG